MSALAHSSHVIDAVTKRRGRGVALVAMLAAIGCVTPPPVDTDASVADGWVPQGVPGVVTVLDPRTEGPPVPIQSLSMRIASVRLVGDRGPALDPRVDHVGLVAVGTGVDVPFADVPPALYSAIDLTLAAEAPDLGAPVFDLRLSLDADRTLEIRTTEPLELFARCERGAVVNTTNAVHVGLDLALALAVQSVLLRGLPPAGADGVIVVDETTAPAATLAFRAELREHVHAECEAEDL